MPRLCLVAAGVEFEDERISFEIVDGSFKIDPMWGEKLKAEQPYGQVPVLTVDGQKIAQSGAICRFIGRNYGMDGENAIQSAMIDAAFETITDCRKAFYAAKDDAEKKANFFNKTLVDTFAGLEKNVAGATFFQGSKMSYADVAFYYLVCYVSEGDKVATEKALVNSPKLNKIYETIAGDSKITAYVAQRKPTPF